MQTLTILLIIAAAYILGSIPVGLIIVKIGTGKDVRFIGSGRTGGTNAMRAAGLIAGLLTVAGDFFKATAAVWLARALLPGMPWVEVGAGLAAVIGHNYSIFLPERTPTGHLRLRGGAGGASCLGAAYGLWQPAFFIIFPLSMLAYLLIGYASITTVSVAILATLLFFYQAAVGALPWAYVAYGAVSILLVAWALRPNFKRLREGRERAVGLRAYFLKKAGKDPSPDDGIHPPE